MDKTMLTPEESILLIAQTIQDTKNKFREIAFIYIFWGIMMFVVTISQFVLIRLGHANMTGLPCFLYLIGGTILLIHYWKLEKKNKWPKTIIGNILAALGTVLGMNFMILGFFFWDKLGDSFAPIFIIFLAFWTIISGVAIKFKPLIISGIVLNLIAFATFNIHWHYHPLCMTLAAVIGLIIPGILLEKERRQENV